MTKPTLRAIVTAACALVCIGALLLAQPLAAAAATYDEDRRIDFDVFATPRAYSWNPTEAVPIEGIPEDAFTPEGYNWGINFTGVSIVKGFTYESDVARYYSEIVKPGQGSSDYDYLVKDGTPGYAAKISRGTPQGSFALRYIGATYDGQKIDAIVTLENWQYVEPIMSNGASGWGEWWERDPDNPNYFKNFQPGVFVNPSYQQNGTTIENFNFYTVGIIDLEVSVKFVYAATNNPVPNLKGHSTCIDLDQSQAFGFGGAINKAQVVASNDHLRIDRINNLVQAPPGTVSADPQDPHYKDGLVGIYFDTKTGDALRLYFVTSWNGVAGTAMSFFAMTNEYLTAFNPDDEDPNGTLPVVKSVDKTSGLSVDGTLTYTVDAKVHEQGVDCRNGYRYTSYEIVDVMAPELRYVDGSGYLADSNGRRIDGAGRVVYEGAGDAGKTENTVKFEFDRTWLQNSMQMRGEHYRFVFKAVLTEYPADGTLSVANSAYAYVNNSGKYPSNRVETTLLEPVWSVDKTSSVYECEVGDTVSFTAVFKQTVDNAQCREAVFSDNLPEGFELIADTVSATGLKDMPAPKISGNSWSLALDKFSYGDTVTVVYKAKALQSGNGYEQVNLAAAHANNAMDGNDEAEVWINTAKFAVEKDVDYYEHYVGASDQDPGTVVYTATVTNTKEGTIANDVIIDDSSLPDGLKVGRTNSGALMVKVEGVPATVDYPVAGADDVHRETERRNTTCTTAPKGTGFETRINHLPYNVPVTLTYTCYPESSVAGWEVVNHATASASNALDEEDDARIWVNQPGLAVDKQASMDEYSVGDFVTYHIKVTNETPGTVGRNLVVSDLLATKGVELQRDSIKVWDSNGDDITQSCTLHYNRNQPTFLIETHRDIVHSSGAYPIWDKEKTDANKNNPLGITKETEIWVDYTVAITDAALAGQTIENHALAATDEPNTKTTDDELIYVKGAALDIAKTSDKKSYQAGETAHYTLTIKQIRDNAVAESVAIIDSMDETGFGSIIEGSIKASTSDGTKIDAEPVLTKDKTSIVGFELETGIDLSDKESLTVTYDVKTMAATHRLGNKAQAKADNAVGDLAAHDIEITDGKANTVVNLSKVAEGTTYRVGDTVTYTLTATSDEQCAKNAVVVDSDLPEGVAIDFDSIAAKAEHGMIEADIERQDNAFTASVGDIETDDRIVITYDAKIVDEKLADTTIVNRAQLTADDAEPAQATETIGVTALSEPDPDDGKPVLSIAKRVDTSTFASGQTLFYAIEVEQTKRNVVAHGVTVTDFDLPSGVDIDYDTVTVDGFPVAFAAGEKTDADFAYQGTKTDQGFEIPIGDLAQGRTVTIAFSAAVAADYAGDTVVNRASAAASNAETVTAEATAERAGDAAGNGNGTDPLVKTGDNVMAFIAEHAAIIAGVLVVCIIAVLLGLARRPS